MNNRETVNVTGVPLYAIRLSQLHYRQLACLYSAS
jgi:hypothetical protein